MCNPLLIAAAGVAITAVSAGVTYKQQSDAAEAQTEAIKNDYAHQQSQLEEQQFQTNAQSQQAMSERAQQARAERARLRVAAGESGLAGNVYDSLLRDSYFQEGTDIATLENNRVSRMQQSGMEGQALRSQAQGNLNQVRRPSLLASGLQIAGSAASEYSDYQNQQARLKAGYKTTKGY